MLIVLPFSHKDATLAAKLLEWVAELDGLNERHPLLLIKSKGMDEALSRKVEQAAKLAFSQVSVISPKFANERGWPESANHLFHTACAYVTKVAKRPFFWLEPDCTPLKKGWIDALQDEYQQERKPYLGFRRDIPVPHISGPAVYPAEVHKFNPESLQMFRSGNSVIPFDVVNGKATLKHAHVTRLIHHDWGTKDNPPTFPTRESLDAISQEAVIMHRCKDGSGIDRLRERQNPKAELSISKLIKKMAAPFKRKLKLPNVTLWACVWSEDKEHFHRTIRVLDYCNRIIEFEKTVMFSYLPLPAGKPYEYVQIPRLPDLAQFNILVNRIVPLALTGEFAMSVHSDGFPIDLSMWHPDFLKYDYCGAPWKDGVVGNGGFNIESRRFMQAKMKLPPYIPGKIEASDFYVCRTHRKTLEDMGMRFAPTQLALRFSTETTHHYEPSLGFHGRKYAVAKYNRGWRLIEESEKI